MHWSFWLLPFCAVAIKNTIFCIGLFAPEQTSLECLLKPWNHFTARDNKHTRAIHQHLVKLPKTQSSVVHWRLLAKFRKTLSLVSWQSWRILIQCIISVHQVKGVYPWLPPLHLLLLILPVGLILTLFPDRLWQRRQKYFMIMMLLKRMSSLCLLMRSVTADLELGVSSIFFLSELALKCSPLKTRISFFFLFQTKQSLSEYNIPKTTVKATWTLIQCCFNVENHHALLTHH